MDYSLSSAGGQLGILPIRIGRGIPCGCPVATGLRAGHFGKGRHEACPYCAPIPDYAEPLPIRIGRDPRGQELPFTRINS